MSQSTEYINSLIAHYLESKGYASTLEAFELELNTKFSTPTSDESLESIVSDRINFDALDSHRSKLDNGERQINTWDPFTHSELLKSRGISLPNWALKYPNNCEFLNLGSSTSLVIHSAYFSALVDSRAYNLGLFVTNTKHVFVYDIDSNQLLVSLFDPLDGQPVKLVVGVENTSHILVCDMNGNMKSMQLRRAAAVPTDDDGDSDEENWLLTDSTAPTSANVKLHRRLITDLKYLKIKRPSANSAASSLLGYFASIGWDSRVTFGTIGYSKTDMDKIEINLLGDYKLFTNPTALLLTLDKSSHLPVVLVGRLESSLLTIFTITSPNTTDCKFVEVAKLSLNDSEFSSHSFQPMSIAELSYLNNLDDAIDNIIITVATDHVPYMRLITVLVPSLREIFSCLKYNKVVTSVDSLCDALSDISVQNPDNVESFQSGTPILRSYIISNFNSLSPQDKYSNAIILSRPNCSGVWIPGDDGKLRGFDLRTGNVVETLDSNDGRAKSAFLGNCSGNSEVVVVCGAVDKKISIWRCS